jgi:LacI family transcriptional regulator
VRESTDTLASADPKVSEAIHYMWDHFRMNISVDDVAAAVGMSRRTLDRSFRRELDRSVSEELLRKRLDELAMLLGSTDDKVVDLAPQVGFSNPEHLYRVFRQTYGMTPRQYRLQAKDIKA